MNIANYFIVSTTDQIPENQRIRLTEHAREKGRDIRICIEGEGTRRTRPVKAEILYKLPHRICNDALDYKLNRWAKSSIELILDINELVKKGIAFIRYVENLHFPRQPDGCMSKSYQPLLDLSGSFFRNDDGGHSQSQDSRKNTWKAKRWVIIDQSKITYTVVSNNTSETVLKLNQSINM